MNQVKRILGFAWILLGIYAGYYLLVSQAIPKFMSDKAEDLVPAIIYTFILMPVITGGLMVFGYYSIIGEYDTK
jgi:hypothetical protein